MTIGRALRNYSVPLKKQLAALRAQHKRFSYLYCIRSGHETMIVFTYEKGDN